jgi:hypothetical protein
LIYSRVPGGTYADQEAHPRCHIVKTKKEIDGMEAQTIFDLLHELEDKVQELA